MAVHIRLTRRGRKKQPFYRIVVADSRSPRDGRFIEIVGHYDSTREPAVVKVDEEKVLAWLQKGAQLTDTAKNILRKEGIMSKWDEMKRSK